MNWTHRLVILAGVALVAAVPAVAAGDFSLATVSVTNTITGDAGDPTQVTRSTIITGEPGEDGSDALFSAHMGSVVVLTNCQVQASNGEAYANTNYMVVVKVGNNDEGVSSYYGSWNMVNTSYWAQIVVPSHTGTVYVQTWVYDENTNLYMYPKYEITVVEPLR